MTMEIVSTYSVGDFVLYLMKNELGLIGEVIDENNLKCWWHTGGTRATISTDMVETVDINTINIRTFSNQYAINSLMKRRDILMNSPKDERLFDLID